MFFLECVISENIEYYFSGIVLPQEGRGLVARDLLRDVVQADALPQGSVYVMPPRDKAWYDPILEVFIDHKLMKRVAMGVQLTELGVLALQHSMKATDFKKVLVIRDGISLEDRTPFEKMVMLSKDGFNALPAPAKQPPAVPTISAVPDNAQFWY